LIESVIFVLLKKVLYRQVLDLYAISIDYDPYSDESITFFFAFILTFLDMKHILYHIKYFGFEVRT
jgi:hypothetical protein